MFLSNWRPCPNYVPNNSESGPTEAAETEFGFGGSYLSFRPRLAVFWQAQLGWCWAELLPGEKNLFFFLFLQAHRCCWILVSQHKIWAHGSELFIVVPLPRRATAALICNIWCFPSLMLQLPNSLGRAGVSGEGVTLLFGCTGTGNGQGKNNQANSFYIAKNRQLAVGSCIFPHDTHYHLLTSKDGPLLWL